MSDGLWTLVSRCCFELHRSWRRSQIASAVRWARFLSVLQGIRSVLATTARLPAIQDVMVARDDSVDALLELRTELRYMAKAALYATPSTLRSLRSSLPQVLRGEGLPSTSPANPVSPASSSLGRPEYYEWSGPGELSRGWTMKDLENLRATIDYSVPQRYMLGYDPPIDCGEWLEAITTWPNPIFQGSEVMTVQGTGPTPAEVCEAEGWDTNPMGWGPPSPEVIEGLNKAFDEAELFNPYGSDLTPLPQFPAPPSVSRMAQVTKIASNFVVTEEMIRAQSDIDLWAMIRDHQRYGPARRARRLAEETYWQNVPEWDNPCVVRGTE